MKIYIISIVCSKVFNASQAWPLLFEPFMIRRLFVGAGAGGRVFTQIDICHDGDRCAPGHCHGPWV